MGWEDKREVSISWGLSCQSSTTTLIRHLLFSLPLITSTLPFRFFLSKNTPKKHTPFAHTHKFSISETSPNPHLRTVFNCILKFALHIITKSFFLKSSIQPNLSQIKKNPLNPHTHMSLLPEKLQQQCKNWSHFAFHEWQKEKRKSEMSRAIQNLLPDSSSLVHVRKWRRML